MQITITTTLSCLVIGVVWVHLAESCTTPMTRADSSMDESKSSSRKVKVIVVPPPVLITTTPSPATTIAMMTTAMLATTPTTMLIPSTAASTLAACEAACPTETAVASAAPLSPQDVGSVINYQPEVPSLGCSGTGVARGQLASIGCPNVDPDLDRLTYIGNVLTLDDEFIAIRCTEFGWEFLTSGIKIRAGDLDCI